ncbi:acyl-CoA dehydrogenase family protein [Amycolatopsis sp. TNS106]|uniref:acyl-CoA dehydrogenase family protein n=1 Tax=Amycolatopsis sp. TNS106 TaxID=2861750 RepID=UPI001C569D03|nr:acyl-CoA dehydrogenase family protein [Amycolatopsis sp. TNS106]QXV56950.1 acyl-CoA dehydrogenase [Amycolatopsis sp. TNS106]
MSADYAASLESVISNVVAPQAVETDRSGEFPRNSVEALGKAGILGLLSSADVGGGSGSLADGAVVIEKLASNCGSTAMVVLMHYAATAILEAHGSEEIRRAIAAGDHLTTLAFSESGSRSHFWAPMSSATSDGNGKVELNASKSWVTAAGQADSYVWSSRPISAEGSMTLWSVPSASDGLTVRGKFDGLGLRGNASNPVAGESVEVSKGAMLGEDGAGLDIALQTALPYFLVLNAAFSLGLMQAQIAEAGEHLKNTQLAHLEQTLAEQEHHRTQYARLLTKVDEVRAFLQDTLQALGSGRADATLRVLQVKAVAAEAASEVSDGVMRLCGGSAFRKELGVERRFRDSLAARVMAPTTEALRDFVGRAALGLPLF